MIITFCILQEETCTDPEETECENACFFSQDSDGQQYRGCTEADDSMAVAFAELDDNDKKCITYKNVDDESIQVCVCNYDRCNENMDNSTNNYILPGLGKALKCSKCHDHNNVGC